MIENTIIIVGDSPFLETQDKYIRYVLEKYSSLGINNAIRNYNVSAHIFQDMKFIGLTNKYPDLKTITLYRYGDLIQKEDKELYDSFTFKFKINTEEDIVKENKLAWCGFTHDYAISYSIMKGYKNIVLLGTADFDGNKHFATEEDFKYSEDLKNKSKKFIEEICSKKATIVTCNPNSYLNIPRIFLRSLLK